MLAWILIGLGLAFVLVLVRLDAGPVQLDWLTPRIERALTPSGGRVAVVAGRTELRLNQEARTVDLVGVDVRYHLADRGKKEGDVPGSAFLVFPEVLVTLSVEALLKRGMIAASEVMARAPSLTVTRREDGGIGLRSEADVGDIDFGMFLQRFVDPPEADDRLAFLKTLAIGGGRVAFYDHRRASALIAGQADLMLTRHAGGVDGWLRADVLQKSSGPAALQVSGRIEAGADRIAFEADIADLMPADLPALWPFGETPLPDDLTGLRLPVRATVDGMFALDGTLSPLKVDLRAGAGVVDLPAYLGEPLDIDTARIDGTIGAGFHGFEIDRALIASRGAEIGGAGSVVWREDEHRLALDLQATDVRADDLAAFWPQRLGVNVRNWVLKNVGTGRVTEAAVNLDLGADDFGASRLRDEAVSGRFAFEGLSVRYVDAMPPLENASGHATFDADRMDFEVEGGRNAGLELSGGSVTITGMGKRGKNATRLRVLADAAGSIEQALLVLDHPPLEVAKAIGIEPSSAQGSVTASLEVRLPLHREVTGDEAVVLADAVLTDFAIDGLPGLGGDVRLDKGAFALKVDEEAVRLDGTAEIDGLPLAIDVVEPLADPTSKRRIGLAGSLDLAELEDRGVAIDGLEGAVGLKATVTETENRFWIDLEADLAALAIDPPGLIWQKPAGQEGMLRASIAMPLDGAIEVRQFDVESGDFQAAGSLALSPANDRLAFLAVDRFRLGDSDAAVRITPNETGGFDVAIEGQRLDLDALFGDDQEFGQDLQRFRAIVDTEQMRIRGIELVDVQADATREPGGWRAASVIGALPSGGKLALELTPDGEDRRLQLRSEDAGSLIEALDLGQRVDGGDVLLSARIASQDPVIAKGRFEIRDFTLRDAPLLARMLTLASLTGIGNLLGGEGIQVDHLILPFTLDDGTLAFADGLLRGSQLGLTVKGDVGLEAETLDLAGTIIPVYTLNRLIGQVPILGRLLTGTDGRGAFAGTYSIKGPHDNPTVYVNPLSILTPGLIRDLFGGLINGTLEPPDIRETDD